MKTESPAKGCNVDTVWVRVKGDEGAITRFLSAQRSPNQYVHLLHWHAGCHSHTFPSSIRESSVAVCIKKENKCEMDKDINEKITAKSVIF